MRLALLGGAYQARSLIASAQRCVNLYIESNVAPTPDGKGRPIDDSPSTHYPTPGLKLLAQTPVAAPSRCTYTASDGKLFRVAGPNVYYVDKSFNHTLLGTIADGSTPVSMADNGSVIVLVDGTAKGYAIRMAGRHLAEIADESFLGADKVDYVDTYFVFNKPASGQFYISVSNPTYEILTRAGMIQLGGIAAAGSGYTDGFHGKVPLQGGTGTGALINLTVRDGIVTIANLLLPGQGYTVGDKLTVLASDAGGTGAGFSWTVEALEFAFNPLDIAGKVGGADDLVSLIVLRRDIWLLGAKTSEPWYDSGAADFAYQIIPGAFIEHGCVAPFSVAKADTSIFWLGQDIQGEAIVLEGAQYAATRISTHAMEDEFSRYGTLSDAVSWTYQQEGHLFFVLTFPTADKTWVYDKATSQWHERAWTDGNGILHRSRAASGCFAYGRHIVADWETANLYEWDLETFTDVGDPITRIRSFPHIVNQLNRVSYSAFAADIEAGNAVDTGLAAILITDGGQNYTSEPNVVISGGGGLGATARAYLSQTVASVSVSSPGSGYSEPPIVTITGGGGEGATGVAKLTNGTVASVEVVTPGSGYASPPTITLSGGGGAGATATCTIVTGVASVTITNTGSGYISAPTIAFTGGGGTGATGTVLIGGVSLINVQYSHRGSGYTSTPTVTLTGGGGTGATAIAHVGGVTGVVLMAGGVSYTAATVTFVGGGGTGAAATAVIGDGNLLAVVITETGSGYVSAPTVVISGDGTGAAATSSILGLWSIEITAPGSGYTAAPSVNITGGGGTGAVATASVGGICGVTITAPGSGYTTPPAVAFTGGSGTGAAGVAVIGNAGIQAISITTPGSGYSSTPTVTFSGGGGGTGATAKAKISAQVGTISVISPGAGYNTAPNVKIVGDGVGAVALAHVSGKVAGVFITDSGSAYTATPTVNLTGGGGTGAAAVAKANLTAEPILSLRWSDSRGKTWGNAVQQNFGIAGEYLATPSWNRLGMARDRVFELSWSTPIKTALNGAYIDVEAAET